MATEISPPTPTPRDHRRPTHRGLEPTPARRGRTVDPSNRPEQQPTGCDPVLRWVGGKGKLLKWIQPLLPEEFGAYHEPFVGGGAVFFRNQPAPARLTDLNGRLIETYRALRDDVDGVIAVLRSHEARNAKAYYLRQREMFNARHGSEIERAARFIYMNKVNFNGLYRENKSGRYNVPYDGTEKKRPPRIVDEAGLRAASRALGRPGVSLEYASFESVLEHAVAGDLVYFDPPYIPTSTTADFRSYLKTGFSLDAHLQLARTFDELARRGCYVVLSNSDTQATLDLYEGWRIERCSRAGTVSSKGDGRGRVSELIVRSW
ncbi:MAG: Dam family site-specific DNA-(adenine-N6)-methyltransferase [Myxococcales bacterium]|nr:Dam family site-specific DNA-(adenine-N6)-methyltransferase [Myxococcales bacterium]MCB9519744.1 Dam family site-specific DNA-(adenine-N6)-methyltransferase [Myxococcales bacterium]MCB9530435.1 Dam family site-specific DNA-(adenine-N6)-methyltransferase [Myxococcales bacterium]MCB9533682.1 Dam family site-specific DNA-(adenine-N6)-methyltransferase [Myxococcales bacterium]